MTKENSYLALKDKFGIEAIKENGKVYFAKGVPDILKLQLCGDDKIYNEIKALMEDVEKNYDRYVEKDNRIIIEADKHLLVFYPKEITTLALIDEELYMKAIRRGKSELRYRINEKRKARCFDYGKRE